MALLRREPTGNVVLNSGDADIRFFTSNGGAPLEFWRHNFPGPITNSYPGSGCQMSFNTGQDPTQASANGNTSHPICCFGLAHTQKHNYYCRETLLDVAAGEYEVSGFAPDFWLSSEGIDDYPCPPAVGWSAINGALSFTGSAANPSGVFCPGNEMEPGQIRRYPGGRIAFKIRINFATTSGIAGLLFRKVVPANSPTKDGFYAADGYHLNVNQAFGWELRKQVSGVQTILAGGSAPPTPGGVLFEVRTHNNVPGHLEVLINGAPISVVSDSSPVLGDAFGCFATCSSGVVSFLDRQIFDLGVTFSSRWKSLGGGSFENKVIIESLFGDRLFYRANPAQCFLNKTLFPAGQRATEFDIGAGWQSGEGIVLAMPGSKFWVGNPQGTLGLKWHHLYSLVDADSSEPDSPHALLAKHAVNDEFIFMFNPLSHEVSRISSRLETAGIWSVTR